MKSKIQILKEIKSIEALYTCPILFAYGLKETPTYEFTVTRNLVHSEDVHSSLEWVDIKPNIIDEKIKELNNKPLEFIVKKVLNIRKWYRQRRLK